MTTNPKNSTPLVLTPARSSARPPRPTPAASSDADVTLELATSRMAVLVQPDPVIKTEELTANDILEVHNAVRAMQAAEVAAASPDRTSEVDALDILEAESIAIEAPRVVLPRTLPPPRRNEPTKIIHRDLIQRVQRALAQKRARTVMMLAAALGTWGFFASFAIGGVYGAVQIAKHFSSHEAPVALVSSSPTPAADDVAPTEKSEDLAPLLPKVVEANELARVSSTNVSASIDTAPRASGVSPNSATSHDDIFRRPSKTQVGVLRVSSTVHGLLVDGTPERVTGGSLILACGDHRIRPPHASARVVRVPCGKTVAL